MHHYYYYFGRVREISSHVRSEKTVTVRPPPPTKVARHRDRHTLWSLRKGKKPVTR